MPGQRAIIYVNATRKEVFDWTARYTARALVRSIGSTEAGEMLTEVEHVIAENFAGIANLAALVDERRAVTAGRVMRRRNAHL
jgi:hypothetical protein